jgi:S1-C subfamily serine protease
MQMVRSALLVLMLIAPMIGAHAQSGPAPLPTYKDAPAQGDAEDERTRYLRQALNPTRPPELQGLHERSMGTGFVVAPQALLTNAHVVRDCTKITAQIGGSGGDLAVVRVDAVDAEQDLAILHLDKPAPDHALFEANFVRVDPTELFVVGFPSLGLPVVEPVLVTAEVRPADLASPKPRLPFSGDVRHGNSGSPLFDNFGAVIGIVTQAVNSPVMYSKTGVLVTDVGFAVPSHTIIDFLRKHAIAPPVGERHTPMSEAERMPESRKIVARMVCWR